MINTAIIGLGYWGPNILRNLSLLSNVKVVVDMDDKNFNGFREKYPDVIFTKDINEIHKNNIDAVAIVTPPNTHFELAQKLSSYHLFIEKPLTHTLKDAESLLKIENKEKRNIVGHVFLFSPEINKLKQMIETREICDIQSINITRFNFGKYQSCGVISDLLPHDISILNYLLGIGIKVKSASYGKVNGIDVSGSAILSKNGIECIINSSWTHTNKVRKVSITAKNGIFEYDMSLANNITIYKDAKLESNILGGAEKVEVPYTSEPLLAEIKYWLNLIEDSSIKQNILTFNDGYEVVRLIEEIKNENTF